MGGDETFALKIFYCHRKP